VGIRRGRDELSAAFPNLKTFVHHT
jgi:hypothetical protein